MLPAPNLPAGDTLAEIRAPRPAAQIASAAGDDPTPGGRDPGTVARVSLAGKIAPGPPDIGSKTAEIRQKSAIRDPPPTRLPTGARAMFLSNNYVKNDMSVSRETIA